MRRLALVLLSALGVLGCTRFGPPPGLATPPASTAPAPDPPASTPPASTPPAPTHEYPSPSVRESVAAASPDPASAVRAFAQAYTNWTAASVTGDLRALASGSVGQARSAMELAAAQTARDGELRRGGVANRGTVEAVAPLPGTPSRYVVITLEATTASATAAYAGLPPAWHVTVAGVAQVSGGGWVVSSWQPED